jgi:hypothetical protein
MGGDWLGRGRPARSRTWALKEQLFAPRNAERDDALIALAARLAEEQAELTRIEAELHERVLRMAGLEQRLNAVEQMTERDLLPHAQAPADDHRIRGPTVDPRRSPRSLQREYWLCRCEGFEVGSPAGRIGVVEGLRFLSRVDQPDLLEVRSGLFGRRLLLLPVEEVESISSGEERIVLRAAPRPHGSRVSELLGGLRNRLSREP